VGAVVLSESRSQASKGLTREKKGGGCNKMGYAKFLNFTLSEMGSPKEPSKGANSGTGDRKAWEERPMGLDLRPQGIGCSQGGISA
jgi:hypothetical protein